MQSISLTNQSHGKTLFVSVYANSNFENEIDDLFKVN
jgi:hypothetical protein